MQKIITPGGGGVAEPPSTGGGGKPPQVAQAADNTMMERNTRTRPYKPHRGRQRPFKLAGVSNTTRRMKAAQRAIEGTRAAAEDLSQAKRGRLVVSRPLALLFLLCSCWPLLLRLVLWLIHVYQFFKYQRKRQAVILAHSTAPYSSLSASCSSSSSRKEVFFLNVSSSLTLARVSASALASP